MTERQVAMWLDQCMRGLSWLPCITLQAVCTSFQHSGTFHSTKARVGRPARTVLDADSVRSKQCLLFDADLNNSVLILLWPHTNTLARDNGYRPDCLLALTMNPKMITDVVHGRDSHSSQAKGKAPGMSAAATSTPQAWTDARARLSVQAKVACPLLAGGLLKSSNVSESREVSANNLPYDILTEGSEEAAVG